MSVLKVYIKIHSRSDIETVACCDEHLLNQCFKEGDLKLDISEHFFGGNLIALDDAIEIIKGAQCFNIVGEHIIDAAVINKILPKDCARKIAGVPMAMKMML